MKGKAMTDNTEGLLSAAEHAREARELPCTTCNAEAGAPCTQPTDTSRKAVEWLHYSRWVDYREACAADAIRLAAFRAANAERDEAANAAVSAPETVTAPKRTASRFSEASLAARREAAEAKFQAELAAELQACRDEYGRADEHTYTVCWVVTAEGNGYEVGSTVYIKARGISDVLTMTRELADKGMLISSIRNVDYLGDE